VGGSDWTALNCHCGKDIYRATELQAEIRVLTGDFAPGNRGMRKNMSKIRIRIKAGAAKGRFRQAKIARRRWVGVHPTGRIRLSAANSGSRAALSCHVELRDVIETTDFALCR